MIASSKNSASGNNDGDTATSGANDNNGNSDDLKRKKKKRKIALRKDNWKIFSQTVNHLTRSLIHGIVEDELNHDFDKYFRDLKVKASNSPYVINVFGNHTESETIKPNVTPEEHKVLSVDKLSLWNEVLNWLPILDEEKSTIVVNYALDNLFFLRNLFDPVTFREEHKLFWTSNATEKHITLKYDRETDEYLWTGLWYAVLTAGFHYCDEDLQKALGFEEMFMNNFAQIFLCCALECVVRGRYMTFPNPRSIQVIQVLSLTCYAFGGDNLQKCSFHSAIYIARKLNFHKVSNNVKNNKILKNIWWNLVSTDWLNSYGRYSFILPNTFVTSLPDDFKLKDPANNNVEVFDVSTYYINVLSKIAIIKRKYYFDDNMSISCLNLISLKKADIELRLLEMNVEKCLRDNHPAKNLNLDPKSEYYKKYLIDYEFLKFILINSLIYHKFEVNKMMINFMNPNYWLSEISPICHHYCIDVLKNYLSPNTSRILQKLWFITEFVVVLACFLLVDVLIHDSPRVKNCQDSINLVNRIKLLLLGFKSLIRPAIRGLYVIDKLLQLIEQQKNKKTLIDLKDMMNMDLVNELSRATANNDPPPPRSRRGSISKSMSKEPTVSVLAKGNVAGKSAITMVNFIKNAYEEEHQSKSENENEISKSPLDMEKKEHSIDQEGKHSNNNSTTDYPQDEYSQVNTIGVSRSSDDAQFALKLGQLRAQGQAAMGAETHSKPETQESISRNQFPNHYKQESRSDEVSKDQTIEMQKESLKPGVLESHHYQEQQPALQKAQPALPLSKSTSYLHSIQDSSSSVPYQAYEVNSTPFTNIPYVYQHVLPNNVVIASDPEFRINQQQEFTQRLNVPFMYQNTAISQIQQLQLQQMQLQQGQAQLDGQQLNQQQMGQQQISQQQIDRQQAMGRQVMSQGQQLNQQGENGNEAKSVIKDHAFSGFNEPSFHSAKDNSGETSYMSQNMLLQSNNKFVPNSIEQQQQKQDPHSVMEGISPSSQPISSLGTHSITSNNVTNPTSYVDGQTINDPNIAGSNGNSSDQQQAFMRSIHANQQQILLQYLNSDKAQAALAASAEAATYGHNATPVQPFSQYPVRPTEINYLEFLPDVMVDVFEGASTAVNFMSAVDNFLEKNKNSDDEDRESTNSFLSNDSSHNSQSQ
ncbi:unnamed protein product [[Candida] boidinii]|uniref:Unnamed protein product n=1 Tax=Candida boidinii TaxID=5477 RepID=A0A9W6SVW3_CANBO|nr:unnamed protein product [[Candida] boidinii]